MLRAEYGSNVERGENMRRVRQKEICMAAITCAAAIVVYIMLLFRPRVSESMALLSSAITCFLLSWLVGAVARSREEGKIVTQSQTAQSSVVVFPTRSELPLTNRSLPWITNAFSIDLEDYFHTEVASEAVELRAWESMPSRVHISVPRLLDLLDEHNTKATVFVLGWVAHRYPSLVREVAKRGHEIACHSYLHRAVFRLDRKTFYGDTLKAKHVIEDATGARVVGYRAPCFSITPGIEWAFDVLTELEFQYDSSVNPVRHVFYGNSSAPRHPYYVAKNRLLEIPVATWRIMGMNFPIGGGAYLRLLPYSYSLAGLNHLNGKEHKPGTVYMHPWEMDHGQPELELPWLSNIRQTWGTKTMEHKVSNLLGRFAFAPMAEVYSEALLHDRPPLPFRARTAGVHAEVVT